MSTEAPDLIIPVRMTTDGAKHDLQELRGDLGAAGTSGQKSGQAIASGMHQAADATQKVENSVRATGSEIGNLMKAQMGLHALKGVVASFGDEWKRVAEEVGRTSKEFQAFRESLQGVSALSGQQNTNQFAAAEIERAERAHVTPKEMKDFRDAFLSKASLYVGEGPDAKLNTKDADEFQEYLSEYSKLKGVSQQEMAGFAGGLLAQQKGPTTAAEMKARAGKAFATLEASSAPVSHLLPGMTRVMAQGLSAEEASRTLAALPEVAPEEESTHLLRVLAEIRRNNVEGKSGAFGIQEGQSPQQQLETLVGNLRQRSGGNQKELDRLLREFTHEDIAANTLRGMVNQVNFDQWRQVQEAVPADQLERTIKEGRQSDAGKQYAVSSRHAVEQARMGMRNDELTRRRQIAETELMANRDFERQSTWTEWAAGHLPGQDDARGQMINRQMIARARAELHEDFSVSDAKASLNSGATDELMRTLLPRLKQQRADQKSPDAKARQEAFAEPPIPTEVRAQVRDMRREREAAMLPSAPPAVRPHTGQQQQVIGNVRPAQSAGPGAGNEETNRLLREQNAIMRKEHDQNRRRANPALAAPPPPGGGRRQ
jgi:hypothetical protein